MAAILAAYNRHRRLIFLLRCEGRSAWLILSMALKALPLAQVQDDDLAIVQRMVGMVQDRVELDCLARFQLMLLVREHDRKLALQHPTHFVVVPMYFRTRPLRALWRRTEQDAHIAVLNFAEHELATHVGRLDGTLR